MDGRGVAEVAATAPAWVLRIPFSVPFVSGHHLLVLLCITVSSNVDKGTHQQHRFVQDDVGTEHVSQGRYPYMRARTKRYGLRSVAVPRSGPSSWAKSNGKEVHSKDLGEEKDLHLRVGMSSSLSRQFLSMLPSISDISKASSKCKA